MDEEGGVVGEIIGYGGEFKHTLDPQRRVAIPKDWRVKGAENRFFLLPEPNGCLQMLPEPAYREFLRKAQKVSIADARMSRALAKLGSMARECVCDKQGRVQIPEKLLEYAGIKKGERTDSEIYLIGAVHKIQIWSVEKWEAESMDFSEMFSAIQELSDKPDSIAEMLRNG